MPHDPAHTVPVELELADEAGIAPHGARRRSFMDDLQRDPPSVYDPPASTRYRAGLNARLLAPVPRRTRPESTLLVRNATARSRTGSTAVRFTLTGKSAQPGYEGDPIKDQLHRRLYA
jgi:hypothetical protein